MIELNPSWILITISILGIIFTIYRYFRDPQVKAESNDALMAQDLKALREEVANLRDNHIHSLKLYQDEINKNVNNLTVQVATLATIIDERIPKNGRTN